MWKEISVEQALYIVGIIITVEGLFKAIEYFIGIIVKRASKDKKIEDNTESLEEYREKTDKRLDNIDDRINQAHKYASDSLSSIEKSIKDTMVEQNKECLKLLEEHKKEYVQRISAVENSITETQAVYHQTVALTSVQIENLTKQVEKHNSVVERMFIAEGRLNLHDEQFKVTNNRLKNIERHQDDED